MIAAPAGTPPDDRSFLQTTVAVPWRCDGQGPPVVLLHGWALDLEQWHPQVRGLAHRYRLLQIDRRGFGRSEAAPDLSADARDVVALLDRLHIDRAALVGMSQGARVAWNVAATASERVAGLVLDGPPAPDSALPDAREEEVSLAGLARVSRDRGLDAVRAMLVEMPWFRLHGGDTDARARVLAMLHRYPGRDLDNLYAAPTMKESTASPPPPPSMPVLIVNGEHDVPQRLSVGEQLAAALPSARRHVIAGAGHLPNLDEPDAYNALLSVFLDRCFH